MTDPRRLELERFVDGELTADENARIAAELTKDAAASAYVSQLRRMRTLSRGLGAESWRDDASPVFPFEFDSHRPSEFVRRTTRTAFAEVSPGHVGIWRQHAWLVPAVMMSALTAASLLVGIAVGRMQAVPARGAVDTAAAETASKLDAESVASEHAAHRIASEFAGAMFASSMGRFRSSPAVVEVLAFELSNKRGVTDRAARGPSAIQAEKLLSLGKALILKEDWEAAARPLQKYVTRYSHEPDLNEARLWLGYSLIRAGEHERAVGVLKPFETVSATDPWTDDGLLQLGRAYQWSGRYDAAAAAWTRLREQFRDSVWNVEALCCLINLEFYDRENFSACFSYCEKLLDQTTQDSVSASWEHRYIGAYCLNSMRRFEDANAWIEKWFDPRSAHEQAGRAVLNAQRAALSGDLEPGRKLAEHLAAEFPELEGDVWLDLVIRCGAMLRQAGQHETARELLLSSLSRVDNLSSEQVGWILGEVNATLSPDEFPKVLESLWLNDERSVVVRQVVRDRFVQHCREHDKLKEAAESLKTWLSNDLLPQVLRARTCLELAALQHNDLESAAAAIETLEAALSRIDRDDLRRELEEQLGEYRNSGNEDNNDDGDSDDGESDDGEDKPQGDELEEDKPRGDKSEAE
jgi:TolA-binding protein